MLLDVPFYAQEEKTDCGPTTLRMALEFLGEKYSYEHLKSLVQSETSGVTWTLGLAKASGQCGFKTEFYTTSLGINVTNFELDYYQREVGSAASSEDKVRKMLTESKKVGVVLEERSIALNAILKKLSKDCLAIVLIDWGKIKGVDRYIGHFVVIVGYDNKNIYVHQPGPINPTANYAIDKILFDTARKAKGTDEDIVFIYRKP